MRPGCCVRLIDSIRARHPDARIYVADDSEEEADYDAQAFRLPYDSGLPAKRNHLIDHTDEPYLLFLDDDFIFSPRTRISKLKRVLEEDTSIGLCAGLFADPGEEPKRYEGAFRKEGRDLYFEDATEADRSAGIVSYGIADMTCNFFMARREMFADVRWNEELKLSEHLEFFLAMYETSWKAAFTPEVIVEHKHERPEGYAAMRGRGADFLKLTFEKYEIDRLHKFNNGAVVECR